MSEVTLTELAKDIGVSKSAINQKVNQEDKDRYFRKVGNKYLISEQGQKIIKSMFKTTIPTYKEQNKQKELLESVLKHSEEKSEEIKEKNKQIEKMQKLLDQQQQLNAEDKKIIHDLRKELALEEPKEQKEYDTPEEQEEKLRLIDEKNRYKDEFEQMKRAWEKAESDNVAVIEQNTELREMLEEAENQPKKWYQFWKRSES